MRTSHFPHYIYLDEDHGNDKKKTLKNVHIYIMLYYESQVCAISQ